MNDDDDQAPPLDDSSDVKDEDQTDEAAPQENGS